MIAGKSVAGAHSIKSNAMACWPENEAIMSADWPMASTESMQSIESSESSQASSGCASPRAIVAATWGGSRRCSLVDASSIESRPSGDRETETPPVQASDTGE